MVKKGDAIDSSAIESMTIGGIFRATKGDHLMGRDHRKDAPHASAYANYPTSKASQPTKKTCKQASKQVSKQASEHEVWRPAWHQMGSRKSERKDETSLRKKG